MILLLANPWDPAARALAERWADENVRLLTSRDLCTRGWSQRIPSSDNDSIALAGESIPASQVSAVLTLTPSITAPELVDIVPGDRHYVAAEMTSFLLFWLSRLRCPVLNRPAQNSLAGPAWRQERWTHVAAAAGIPIDRVRRTQTLHPAPSPQPTPSPVTSIRVVGQTAFGDAHPALLDHARTLARVAQVELLVAHFSSPDPGARLVSASPFPSLDDAPFASAVLDRLRTAGSQASRTFQASHTFQASRSPR